MPRIPELACPGDTILRITDDTGMRFWYTKFNEPEVIFYLRQNGSSVPVVTMPNERKGVARRFVLKGRV